MGLDYSKMLAGASSHDVPQTVLVPPLFERDLKARSRMVKSSYDYQFAKPALRWLFGDYYGAGLNSVLFLAPSADPRVSVKAKIGSEDAGTLCLRFQPLGAEEPLCFADVKASPRTAGDVTLRLCGFTTEQGLGAFATLPLAKHVSGKRAQVGVRYSSPDVAAGAIAQPATNTLAAAWLVGRYGGVTAGLQLRPDIDLGAPGRALQGACRDAGGWSEWLRSVSSFALAYSPDGGRGREARTRGGQPRFTAAVEVAEGRAFVASFFQHMAAVRQVINPLEGDDVVGITNYFDVGMQLRVPLVPENAAAAPGLVPAAAPGSAGTIASHAADAPGLRVAAAWQANKNVLVKARLGSDGLALLAAFKGWWEPSVALAASVEYNFRAKAPRYGLTMQVENFGALRYERSREAAAAGRALTQRHAATNAEIALAAGDRPYVALGAPADAFNAAEPASVEYL